MAPAAYIASPPALVTRRESRGTVRMLRMLVDAVIALPLVFLLLRESALGMEERLISSLTWIFALLPARHFLRMPEHRRPPIPFLPIIGLAYGLYFALQGVIGSVNVYLRYDAGVAYPTLEPALYRTSVQLVFIGWMMVLLGYICVPRFTRRRAPPESPADFLRLAPAALMVLASASALSIAARTMRLPSGAAGILNFYSTLAQLALIFLVVLLAGGYLSRRQRTILYLLALLWLFAQVGTTATALMLLTLLGIALGFWLGGGRIRARWVISGVVAALTFIAMRGVVGELRMTLAQDQSLSGIERSTAMVGLIAREVEAEGVVGAVSGGWKAISTRAALLDLFTDVTRQTPAVVPHWDGATYLSLVGAFVPRVLWPDKPRKTLGWDFGHRYGYLATWDYTTTINMPFLVEFYANFGESGVLLGMLLVGVIYGLLDRSINRPGQSVMVSVVALGLMMPLVNIESDFSLVFGGLFLNGVALLVLYRYTRNALFRRRLRAAHAGGRVDVGRVSAPMADDRLTWRGDSTSRPELG